MTSPTDADVAKARVDLDLERTHLNSSGARRAHLEMELNTERAAREKAEAEAAVLLQCLHLHQHELMIGDVSRDVKRTVLASMARSIANKAPLATAFLAEIETLRANQRTAGCTERCGTCNYMPIGNGLCAHGPESGRESAFYYNCCPLRRAPPAEKEK